MNALELLKDDHDKVKALFEEVKATEDGDHTELTAEIATELTIHTHIEETIFYPQLMKRGDEELVKIVEEGIEEHRQVKFFLEEIEGLADESEKLDAKLQVVMEDVEHHIMEEEGEMFDMVEEQFDSATLDEWGRELKEEKQKFKKGKAASGN